jgi:hypothetical protein
MNYMKILENLLEFRNESLEYTNVVRLKIDLKLVKGVLPSILSNTSETNVLVKKSISLEWKKFVFLCLFSTLISSSNSKEISAELQKDPNTKIFLENLLSNQIMSKTQLLQLDQNLPKNISDNIIENFSIFNGKYYEIMWICIDFLLGDPKLYAIVKSQNTRILENLIENFRETTELASPHSLASLVKSAKSLNYLVNTSDSRGVLYEKFLPILNSLYKFIWDNHQDVRNFNDSFIQFLGLIFSRENLLFDSDNLLKKFLVEVIILYFLL